MRIISQPTASNELIVSCCRLEKVDSVGGTWQAAAASVRAVVFVLDSDGDEPSARAVTEIRQLLGMNSLLNVPVLLLASRSAGSSEVVGKERPSHAGAASGTGPAHDARDALKRRLDLDHILTGRDGGVAGGQQVELFVLAGEEGCEGCEAGTAGADDGLEAALEWLRARVDSDSAET